MSLAAPALPEPGEVIAGKYRIERVLGEGGMGVVFEARHERLDERFAVKMLHPGMLAHPEVVGRFEREARAAVKLRGRNVARVTDVDVLPSGVPFMVMEYLDGQDLAEELAERGQMPVGEAVGYVLQACSAMHEAHARGIVHRDLKPNNLFLTREGDGRCVKVLDFGISKMAIEGDSAVTQTHTMLGTPLYMSPEQVRSAKNVDARTDVWSLGVILYELITGAPPFPGESAMAVASAITGDSYPPLATLRPEIPRALEAVVARALAKPLDERYQSVDELAEELLPFADDPGAWRPVDHRSHQPGLPRPSAPGPLSSSEMGAVPTVAAPNPPTQPGWSRGQSGADAGQPVAGRRRSLLLVLGGVGLLVVLGLGLMVARGGGGGEPAPSAQAAAGSSAAPAGASAAPDTAGSSVTAAGTQPGTSASGTAVPGPSGTASATASPSATASVGPSAGRSGKASPSSKATSEPTVKPPPPGTAKQPGIPLTI